MGLSPRRGLPRLVFVTVGVFVTLSTAVFVTLGWIFVTVPCCNLVHAQSWAWLAGPVLGIADEAARGVHAPFIAQSLLAERALPPFAPINRDHAREHERKSEFCFEVGNEAGNPPRRGNLPIKCWRVARAQVAKKPNRKPGCVNRPADAFGIRHPTPARSSPPSPPAEQATAIGAHVISPPSAAQSTGSCLQA
jgi:hypothetical protein